MFCNKSDNCYLKSTINKVQNICWTNARYLYSVCRWLDFEFVAGNWRKPPPLNQWLILEYHDERVNEKKNCLRLLSQWTWQNRERWFQCIDFIHRILFPNPCSQEKKLSSKIRRVLFFIAVSSVRLDIILQLRLKQVQTFT